MPSREGKLINQSRIMFRRAIPLSVEEEVLGALREALGNDLCVERVREDLGPVLEQSIGRDAGGPAVVVLTRGRIHARVDQMAPRIIHASACAIAGAHSVPVRSRNKPRMSPWQKWVMSCGNANAK